MSSWKLSCLSLKKGWAVICLTCVGLSSRNHNISTILSCVWVWFQCSFDIVPVGPRRVWPGVSSRSVVRAAVCGRGQEPSAGAGCVQEWRTPVAGNVPELRCFLSSVLCCEALSLQRLSLHNVNKTVVFDDEKLTCYVTFWALFFCPVQTLCL